MTACRLFGSVRRIGRGCLVISLLSALTFAPLAIASPRQNPAPAKPATPPTGADTDAYHVKPADVVEITVLKHEDLTKSLMVLPDGTLSYPFIGDFKAAGMTAADIRQRITDALATQLRDPQVTVSIKPHIQQQAASVSVFGNGVKNEGPHVLIDDWHVLDLLAAAGGLVVPKPEWVTALLVHGDKRTSIDLIRAYTTADPDANLPLKDGDILLVNLKPSSHIEVQIQGQVNKPGPIPVPADGSVVAAIDAAGGYTPLAALGAVILTHGDKKTTLDLRSLRTEGRIDVETRLEAGDTLYIPPNKQVYSVIGAVSKQGDVVFPESDKVTVVSALTQAGFTSDANLRGVKLLRRSGVDGKPSVTLNVENMFNHPEKNIELQPGDVLLVSGKKQGGFNMLSYLPLIGLLGL